MTPHISNVYLAFTFSKSWFACGFLLMMWFIFSGSDGNNEQYKQHLKHFAPTTAAIMAEQQKELTGHSAVSYFLFLSIRPQLMCTIMPSWLCWLSLAEVKLTVWFMPWLAVHYILKDLSSNLLLQMLTSYPYPDMHYGGMMTYGAPVRTNLFSVIFADTDNYLSSNSNSALFRLSMSSVLVLYLSSLTLLFILVKRNRAVAAIASRSGWVVAHFLCNIFVK